MSESSKTPKVEIFKLLFLIIFISKSDFRFSLIIKLPSSTIPFVIDSFSSIKSFFELKLPIWASPTLLTIPI